MATSFASVPRFQKLLSSDESDLSDGEIDSGDTKFALTETNSANTDKNVVLQPNSSETLKEVVVSKKLEIVENRKNLNKKFSIWSEILMEEELNESMNKALKLKRRRKKLRNDAKESDNYYNWTKEDFERKFAVKKTNSMKKKIKSKELKKDAANDISRQLKESRIDIIRRIVQVVGEEKTRKLAAEVLDIESAGGMMTSDSNRRRSPGGVLFYLVKNESCISSEQKRSIFCDNIVKLNDKQMKKDKKNTAKCHQNFIGKKKNNKKSKKKNKKK